MKGCDRILYTRSEISNMTGIGFDALRYYEKINLLHPTVRSSNNYRQYDENAIERLAYIKLAKKCGFTLNEIRNSLGLFDNKQDLKLETDEIIDLKVKEIEIKMNLLQNMKEMLLAVKEPLKNKNCDQILSVLNK
jgi:DNA-binding transcriptional MerR regulator